MAAPSERFGLGRFHGPMGKPEPRDVRNIVNYWRDTVLNQPKDEVTRVAGVDFNHWENTIKHNSHQYARGHFVMRRGQSFVLTLELTQAYNPQRDDIRLVFQFGKKPMVSKETDIELYLSTTDPYKGWNATVEAQNGTDLRVLVTTPPTCYVGRWTLKVHTVVKKEGAITVHNYNHDPKVYVVFNPWCKERKLRVRVTTPPICYVGRWTMKVHTVVKKEGAITVHNYNHDPKVYVVFNPWCKDDTVYLEDEAKRREYVISDTGYVYAGTRGWRTPNPKSWDFAQFEAVALNCVMYLLEENSYMKDTVRGNPINISRKLSALVNSSDDDGILTGNWSGDYEGGTSPLAWTGTQDILTEYMAEKEPVRYGQCWVFSAVLTTMCRALGIPCRSITNYSSAHDTDGSSTIDAYVDEEGDKIEYLSRDSVWNFHVWNDVWMTRPDLPEGYDGWQAIDATPQETSDGVYCMGPMPLKAIKEGETTIPYDGAFVFAEVNGDRLTWVVDSDNNYTLSSTNEDSVGEMIATKMVGENKVEYITGEYKHQEFGRRNRTAVERARLRGNQNEAVTSKYSHDVKMDIKLPADVTEVGETLVVNVVLKNTSKEKRTVRGKLHIASQYYTGIIYRHIDTLEIKDIELKPGEEKIIVQEETADKYFNCLPDHCPIRINCFVKVLETREPITKECRLELAKPTLTITAPEDCTVEKKVEVKVSFRNKLDMPLTNCELRIEGPGLQQAMKRKLTEKVPALGTFVDTFDITPAKSGKRELCVNFNSHQLLSINASHTFNVME